jgi:hypothetical protein
MESSSKGGPYRDSSLQEILPYLLYGGTSGPPLRRHTTIYRMPSTYRYCLCMYAEPHWEYHMVGQLRFFLNH